MAEREEVRGVLRARAGEAGGLQRRAQAVDVKSAGIVPPGDTPSGPPKRVFANLLLPDGAHGAFARAVFRPAVALADDAVLRPAQVGAVPSTADAVLGLQDGRREPAPFRDGAADRFGDGLRPRIEPLRRPFETAPAPRVALPRRRDLDGLRRDGEAPRGGVGDRESERRRQTPREVDDGVDLGGRADGAEVSECARVRARMDRDVPEPQRSGSTGIEDVHVARLPEEGAEAGRPRTRARR